MSSPSAIVFEHGVPYLQVKIIHFWMHSCSYQRGRVFCSILCVYCFFTRSVNELSFGSMWCWKKGCTEKNSLTFLMGNCGLFLECINILILFTFFLQKYLTPTSLLPQTTQHFWLCSFLTLREIQRISFTQLISMVAIFSLAFRKPFSFSNFFISNRKKLKFSGSIDFFSLSFFHMNWIEAGQHFPFSGRK